MKALAVSRTVRFSLFGAVLQHLLLLIILVVMVSPFLWMVSSSFKTESQIFALPPQWAPKPVTLENYVNASDAFPLGRFYLNSLFVALSVMVCLLLTSSLAAYVFARLQFPARDTIFFIFLATMMLPSQITLIPRFIIMKELGWINTYKALIFPFIATPFATFLLRQAFLDIPVDLEDAARMDGCSRIRILFQVVLPLAKPALATLATFTFMDHWNAFLWPLIVIQTKEKLTLQVGLSMLRSELGTEWGTLMAASVLAALPTVVVYFFAQRQFISGITLTGIKG
jgi:multiple sugar transport system permease protein